MSEFYGDLLVGGATLKHVRGELARHEPLAGTHDYLFFGRLTLSPAQNELVESGRRYRLQLEDGRAGCVVVSRIDAQREDELVVEFEPHWAVAQAR